MKLRNLMYATMIACAFASCSKDDVIDGGQEPVNGETSLKINVGVRTKGVVATVDDPETTINNLNVFVIAADGTVLDNRFLSNTELNASGATTTVEFTGLTPQNGIYCIGFANIGEVAKEALTTAKILAVPANVDDATDLPMHGISGTGDLTPNTTTTLTIDLVRDLARVELNKITMQMKYDQGEFQGDFLNATAGTVKFDFVSATINHAATSYSYVIATTSGYSSTATLGTTFGGGLTGWTWNDGTADFSNTGSAITEYAKSGSDYFTTATQNLATASYKEEIVTAGASKAVFYVLPAAKTVLTLNGTMTLNGIKKSDGTTVLNEALNSYFNVEIGKTGTVTPETGVDYTPGSGIVPNMNYVIDVVLIGKGSLIDGGRPTLIVNTTVKAMSKVTQVAPVK